MNEADRAEDDEFTLLNILLVVAESWFLLTAGTVIAAILGFAYASTQPVTYRAVAELEIPLAETQQLLKDDLGLLAHMTSFDVVVSEGQADRSSLLSVSAGTPEAAQEQAVSVADAFRVARQPALDERRAQMQTRLDRVSQRLSEIDATRQSMEDASARIESQVVFDGAAFAELADVLQRLDAERYTLLWEADEWQRSIAEIPEALPVSPPAASHTVESRNVILITVAAGTAAAAILLVFVFIRHRLKIASHNPAGSEKLALIKRAFRLHRRA